MPCYHSKPAWTTGQEGRESLSFTFRTTEPDFFIDCGKCEGCRARARTDWATRIYHEAQTWEYNSFLTLTYNDNHVPLEIQKTDIQKFIKRLRKANDRPVRYFVVGEYGDNTHRPHYHAIIFNEDFMSSRYHYRISDSMYSNTELERLWGMGQITISPFNHARANYTAGYTTKKINDTDTFSLQSRNPPIGKRWLQKNHDNIRRNETIIIDGKEIPIPRVYLNWLKGAETFQHIKENLREKVKPLNDQKLRSKKLNYLSKQNQRTHQI